MGRSFESVIRHWQSLIGGRDHATGWEGNITISHSAGLVCTITPGQPYVPQIDMIGNRTMPKRFHVPKALFC